MHPATPTLPDFLAERLRPLNTAPLRRGRYILYWMHHAMRSDENPALETALATAEESEAAERMRPR